MIEIRDEGDGTEDYSGKRCERQDYRMGKEMSEGQR